jgi:hypothetical protein
MTHTKEPSAVEIGSVIDGPAGSDRSAKGEAQVITASARIAPVKGADSFSELPAQVQFQLAVFGPFLFGAVCGFLLGESAAGWWIGQAVAGLAGFAGGLEHPGPRPAALRGLVAGVFFGLGIVAGDAISGDPPVAEAPEPIGLIVVLAAFVGSGLGALGGFLRGRSA